MNRRAFLSNMTAGAVTLSAVPAWAMGEKQNMEKYGVHSMCASTIGDIGGMKLTAMRDFHVKDFKDNYLPLWDGTIRIDKELGGFMPYLKPDGTHVDTIKRMYYQGRGIWMFSYLYNHYRKEDRYLDAAKKGIDFVRKYCRDERGYWISEVTREGKPLTGSVNIYGDMYMAMGLGEFYKATGDEAMKDLAIETAHKVNERIVDFDYQHLGGHGAGHEPGTKRLGTWQHFLAALTPLARQTGDYGVEMLARSCVRNILERHWQPDLGVFFEHLDDMFQPFRADPLINHRMISGWHSIQACWMVMEESLRTGHKHNFQLALEMGRITLEKCWYDDGTEAGLSSLSTPEAKPSGPGANSPLPWGAIDDMMVFCLLAIEHTNAPWAYTWYDKAFKTSYAHMERQTRECLLHHPRRLFFAPEIIDHMIERGGHVSDFLQT